MVSHDIRQYVLYDFIYINGWQAKQQAKYSVETEFRVAVAFGGRHWLEKDIGIFWDDRKYFYPDFAGGCLDLHIFQSSLNWIFQI